MRKLQAARALVVEREMAATKAAHFNNPEMREWHQLRARHAREHLAQLEAEAAV